MKTKMFVALLLGFGLIWATGCGKSDPPKADPKVFKDTHDHGEGPHGGVIIELDKYHGEFKPDHKAKSATVWILDEKAKNVVPIKAEKLRLIVSNTNPKIEI